MTAPVTYRPEEVAEWQSRAQHFYHQAGEWHGPAYISWIDRNIIAFCADQGLPASDRLRGHQDEFDVWLAERCPCTGSES